MNTSFNMFKSFEKPLILALIVTLMMSIFVIPISANAQSNELSEKEINAIASGAFYNTNTELYEYDESIAITNGAKEEHARSMGVFLESLSKEDVKELNETIGFDPSVENSGEISTQALPVVLIPIAKFLVGTAGAVIVTEVTLYGIAKACENLEGQFGFFDDFCETRGYI